MDRYLTILQPITTRDNVGDPVVTWQTLKIAAGEIMRQTSREFRASLALRSETEYVFRIRYDARITSDMRLVYENKTLQLLGDPVEDLGYSRRQFMLISAARVNGV